MKWLTFCFLFISIKTFAQNNTDVRGQLSYAEFLGYVKKFHPLVKSANLDISAAEANLMMARGAFDPKIEVDFDEKKFKDTEYYSILNSSFKIPTWYGVEIKAGFDTADGRYLNPQNSLPDDGLASVGISLSLAQGLVINQRMADLRKAKILIRLTQAETILAAVDIIYDASVAYFNWVQYFNEVRLYEKYLSNSQGRYNGIVTLIEQGDKPAIDSIEAAISIRNRKLNLEEAKLKLLKSKLQVSNFLWLDNSVPIELQEAVTPEENVIESVEVSLEILNLAQEAPSFDDHAKITVLENEIELLEIDTKLKSNMLLPKIDLGYSLLSENQNFTTDRFDDYKIGLNFSFPLFLRKERGSLQITKFKLEQAGFKLDFERTQLKNKVDAKRQEIASLQRQKIIITDLVADYNSMLNSEERLFSFGESSLFLINTRENSVVSAQLSKINLEARFLESVAAYYKILASPDF